MINLIAQTLAVPYGYTKDAPNMGPEDSDGQWQGTVCNNNTRNITSVRNGPLLPDLILDTPPPSPLRRAHSYHFTFSEKSSLRSSLQMGLSHSPSSASTYALHHTLPSLHPVSSISSDGEFSVPTVSLEHIQEVRRQILVDTETRDPSTHIPQLIWDVPLPSPIRIIQSEPLLSQQDLEGQKTLKTVGGHLRRIADKFHMDHNMVVIKKRCHDSDSNMNISLPSKVTRCLQVSVVAIFCWRMFNKLR